MTVTLIGACALASILCGIASSAWWRARQERDAAILATITAEAIQVHLEQDRLRVQAARDAAQRDADDRTVDLATARAELLQMRAAQTTRLAAERQAAMETEQAQQQRAADLETYRAYLYDLMPTVCQRAGLDPSLIDPAWPVPMTGKLNDVVHHLAALDQRGHPLSTLGDVIDAFVRVA